MLDQIKQSKTPWLRLLTPSLTPPGGRLLRTLTGHSDRVNAVAVTFNGKYVISVSSDKTLKVWNRKTGEILATFTGEHPLLCCAVALNGVTIVAGDTLGRVHFWQLESGNGL